MQPPLRIHRLTAVSDIAHLRALNAVFGRAFDDAQTYGAEPPDNAYLARLLVRDHVIVLVALIEGEVVGGLVAYELEKFERARSEIYIYDLAVDEPHRRQGIATALIQHLTDLAAARMAWVIYVQADRDDAPAIALYDKLGIREDVLHFDLRIPGR